MQFHEIVRDTTLARAQRIGRGGKRGKTSGRGQKGQTSRAGNSTRPEMREIIKKLPKLRGHGVNRARTVVAVRNLPLVVNLSLIDAAYAAGEEVTPSSLVAKGLLRKSAKRLPLVKILAEGDVTKKVIVTGCVVSAAAKAKIEKAGGEVK